MVIRAFDPLRSKAAGIRLVLTDCDGVLTDAGVYYSSRGEEMKRFSLRDGMGVERLRSEAGIETGIVTRENSGTVARRAARLAIQELHQGATDKLSVVRRIAARRRLDLTAIAYIGDDVNDLDVLRCVGLSACPADAVRQVREIVDYVCEAPGGHGAFRETAELILDALATRSIDSISTADGEL